jgi:flagellar motor switch/type III secretory pathway protein FliN
MSDPEASLAIANNEAAAQTSTTDLMSGGVMRSIPFRLAVTIPVAGLKLRSVRELCAGQVITTDISASEDVPVRAGGALLGYAELDDVEGTMAVRMTRLS